MKCPKCKGNLSFVSIAETKESAYICNDCMYIEEVDEDKHEEYQKQREADEERMAVDGESVSLGGFE